MKRILLTILFLSTPFVSAAEECLSMMDGMSCSEIKSSSADIYNKCCTDGHESSKIEAKDKSSFSQEDDISAIIKKLEEKQKEASIEKGRNRAAIEHAIASLKYMDEHEKWIRCKETKMLEGTCGKEPETPVSMDGIYNKPEDKAAIKKSPCMITKGSKSEFCDGVEYRAVEANYIGETRDAYLGERNQNISDLSIIHSKASHEDNVYSEGASEPSSSVIRD